MWYHGIFCPMDRYGSVRKNRLVKIEESLDEDWNVRFVHFRSLKKNIEDPAEPIVNTRAEESEAANEIDYSSPDPLPKWLTWPCVHRVSNAVGIFARLLLVGWLMLIALFLIEVRDQPSQSPPNPSETRLKEQMGTPN